MGKNSALTKTWSSVKSVGDLDTSSREYRRATERARKKALKKSGKILITEK
jgi:hypothetical protein